VHDFIANWGEEFVYPKSRALELAKVVKAPILFTELAIPVEVTEPIKPADDLVVVQLRTAPVVAIKPTGEEVAVLEVVTPPPAFVRSAKELPGTASNLPLLALLGSLMLGGSPLISVFARRVQ